MKRIADSFGWPFRRTSATTWAIGLVAVILLPVAFVPLLGYAVAATRRAEQDHGAGPPPWPISGRLLSDGFWTALAIALTVLPFAVLLSPVSAALNGLVENGTVATVAAVSVLVLAWGLLALLLLPHATARFAASGRPADMLDFVSSIRGVRRDFATWNVVLGAIVTAWAIGLACAALLCVGVVPGVFYAILVSAHATAALHRPGADPPTG